MTIEDRLRRDLHSVRALPVHDELADNVLTRLRRQRRMRAAGAGLAGALVIAVAIPVVSARLGPGPDTGSVPTPTATPAPTSTRVEPEPQFARPGGGPRAIHLYRAEGKSYLLDVERGRYVTLDHDSVSLSPDLTKVAISDSDGWLAVADRAALLSQGEAGLHWTDLDGYWPRWSPDGRSVLVTEVDKSESPAAQFLHAYDVGSGRLQSTRLPRDAVGAHWAPDSTGFLALRATPTSGGLRPGALQYLAPDGTWGAPVIADLGGSVVAYSPSRKHLLTDSSQLEGDSRPPSKIVEVATNAVVAETGGRPVGWYDDAQFIRLVDLHRLEVVDLGTGAVTRSFEFAGLFRDHFVDLEFGPSDGLPAGEATYGF